MRYISMFSGIEAASVAFSPLGWEPICFAEIEAFPSSVLAHHFPSVPNVGDMTAHDWSQYRGECDLVVGGPPCQAFSVAGLRRSLDDDRGNLSLKYVKAIHAIDPLWCITENVPGWLSTKDNAFGCFLAGLVGEDAALEPTGGRWTDAGVVDGPRRTAAWIIKDAQYFGVPQRRRRVFVVSVRGSGNWRCAAALFPLGHCLQGHPAPRREAGETVAPTIAARTKGGGGLGTDFDCDGGLIASALATKWRSSPDNGVDNDIVHALRADGFDASEDGTGRGTPLVAHCFDARQSDVIQYGNKTGLLDTDASTHAVAIQNATRGKDQNGLGIGGDQMFTLDQGSQHAVAFYKNQESHGGGNDIDRTPPLKAAAKLDNLMAVAFAQNHRGEVLTKDVADSLTVGGGKPGQGYPAVALNLRGREGGAMPELDDIASLRAASGGSSRSYVSSMVVRRLTPRECERLQGFPDDFTLVPYRNKPAADGPRYKALGNSMAVPVVAWIGERIKQVMEIA